MGYVVRHYGRASGFAGDRIMVMRAGTDCSGAGLVRRRVKCGCGARRTQPASSSAFDRTIAIGIGVDYGLMLATRVGVAGSAENSDLVWVGEPAKRGL